MIINNPPEIAFINTIAAKLDRLGRVKPLVVLSIRTGVLLILYLLIEAWLMIVTHLPQESYFQPVIFIELIRNIGVLQLVVLAVALIALHWYRSLWLDWTELEHGKRLRWLILLFAFVLAWSYSTYDYNWYFNQAHYLDRALILLFFALIYWRPVFILPFLLMVILVASQFHYPIGGYSTAEQFQLVKILILFVAAFLVQIVTGRRQTADVVFMMLTLVAAYYWWSGVGKVRLNWITYGHIPFLMFATYANGWLGFLDPETITKIVHIVSWFDWPMMAFTLAVECGAILFLWRKRVTLVLLGGWILLHLGIVALSGIFFWQWIIRNTGLLLFLGRDKQGHSFPIFTREHFLLSLIIIGGSKLWFNPANLAWYDTRISYTYRFEAIGESGASYSLSPLSFSPYYYPFTLGAFAYLVQQPQLTIVWGSAWDRPVADALLAATSPQEIFAIEAEMGTARFDTRRAIRFDEFLTRFVSNLNERRSTATWLSSIQSPPQLLTFAKNDVFRGQEKITALAVRQVTSLFDGEKYSEIRTQELRRLIIPPAPIPSGQGLLDANAAVSKP